MSENKNEKPYRVLALDGGGMRGLYTAKLLETLAQRFDKRFTGEVQPDIGAAFDLICGTSTGSILACALAAGVSIAKVRQLYTQKGAEIFPNPMPRPHDKGKFRDFGLSPLSKWAWTHRAKAAGNAKKLHDVLLDTLGPETLGEVFKRRKIALCIPTVDAVKHHPVVLKTSHNPEKHRDENYRLVDVCLASSSAPIYMPIHRMKDPDDAEAMRYFVDGGLWANNPILIALVEALQVTHGKREIQIISAGTCSSPTGDPVAVQEPDWGILNWKVGVGIVEMSMSAQARGLSFAVGLVAQSLNTCGHSVHVVRLPEQNRSPSQYAVLGLDRSDMSAIQTLLSLATGDADMIHATVLKERSEDNRLVADVFSTFSELGFHKKEAESV